MARAASARYLAQVGGLGTFFSLYVVSNPSGLVFVDVPQRIIDGFWYVSGSVGQFQWSWPVSPLFWAALASATAGIFGRHIDRPALETLLTVAVAGLLPVWIVAFQTVHLRGPLLLCRPVAHRRDGRSAAWMRWKLPVRFIRRRWVHRDRRRALSRTILAVHRS